MGRHPRDRLRRRRSHPAREPQRQRRHAALSRAAPARRSARHRETSCSTARSSRSTNPAGRASNCCNGGCTWRATSTIRRLVGEVPVTYVLFDVLWHDGHSTMELPYAERRALLRDLELNGPSWQTPPHEEGDGATTVEVSKRFGLEGVVAKRLDARYEPGRRSRDVDEGEEPTAPGVRRRRLAARREGTHGQHRFAARRLLRRRRAALRGQGRQRTFGTGHRRARNAASRNRPAPRVPSPAAASRRACASSSPTLVVEVRFTEWTTAGNIRHPTFLGTRTDKDPRCRARERRLVRRRRAVGSHPFRTLLRSINRPECGFERADVTGTLHRGAADRVSGQNEGRTRAWKIKW